MFNNYCYM